MLSNHPNCLGGNGPSASSDLIGDVDGPASATDNAVARFDGTTGKLIQNSVVTIADTTGDIAGASSLTSPAATNLTLAGGSSGASLVLGQGANGGALFTPKGTGIVDIQSAAPFLRIKNTTSPNAGGNSTILFEVANDFSGISQAFITSIGAGNSGVTNLTFGTSISTDATATERMRLTNLGNLLIGTTTDMSGSGGLKVAGTTAATNTTSGAVQIGANIGLSGNSGGPSYFGGLVEASAALTQLQLKSTAGTGLSSSNLIAFNDSAGTRQAYLYKEGTSGKMVIGNDQAKPIVFAISGVGDILAASGTSSANGVVNISPSTSATTSTTGALTIGNGTAATNVAIGGGKINIGDTTAGSSGAGALVVAGGLATGAASYFGGAVTVSSANPSLTLSGSDGKLVFTDTGVGVTSRNWAIGYSQAAEGDFLIKVSTAVGGDPISGTTALGFDRTGAATFAGAVTAASAAPEIVMIASSGNPMLRFSDTTGTVNNRNWKLTSNNSANGDFLLMRSLTTGANAGTVALGFDRDGAATFAGAVTVSGTGASSFAGPLIVGAATSAVQTAWTATTYNGHIAFPDTSQFSVYSEPNANYRGGGMLANIVRTTVGWDFANSASPGWRVGFGNGPLQDAFAISRTPATTFGEVTFLGISNTGAATFSGAVTIGNTVNTVSPTSPNRTITMVVGGVTLYIAAKTTND